MTSIKGQFFRIKVGGKIVAASKSCSIHKVADVEESSTKDTTGTAKQHEVVATSWDGSANGVVTNDAADTTAYQAFELTELVGTTVTIEYAEVGGDKNRADKSGGVKYSGSAIVNDVQLEFPDRADSTYSIQFTGNGELTKGTIPAPTTDS